MEFLINKKTWFLSRIVKTILVFIFLAYAYSMFIEPFIYGGWSESLKVWSSWQSLNVGFLALASSIIAFYIARYNAEQQRKIDFIAAKAFLPGALSELSSYFSKSAILYIEAFARAKDESDSCETPLSSILPSLPSDYKNVFSQCISSASADVGEHLAIILYKLQIHHSRLTSEHEEFKPKSIMLKIPTNIMYNIILVGNLQALINKTFPFARNLKDLDFSPLTIADYVTAYRNIGVEFEDIDGLYDLTSKHKNLNT